MCSCPEGCNGESPQIWLSNCSELGSIPILRESSPDFAGSSAYANQDARPAEWSFFRATRDALARTPRSRAAIRSRRRRELRVCDTPRLTAGDKHPVRRLVRYSARRQHVGLIVQPFATRRQNSRGRRGFGMKSRKLPKGDSSGAAVGDIFLLLTQAGHLAANKCTHLSSPPDRISAKHLTSGGPCR